MTTVPQITNLEELHAALAAPRFLLFKHSLICPTSTRAFGEYERFVEAHPDLPTGCIDVIGRRTWSQEVAATTGVRHESPQALLFVDRAVAWHASHGGITEASLRAALAAT